MAFWKLEDFFLDSEGSDIRIRFQCQDVKEFEIPGHSAVLRGASKIFQTMMQSSDFKAAKPKVLEIKVQGDFNDVINFVRYLYRRTLQELDISSYISILQTAHSYGVTDLTKLCERLIRQKVTPYSACKIFLILEKVITKDLQKFLLDFMLKSAFLIFENKFHVSLSEETMKLLMESDQLNVVDERQVIDALWSWALTVASIENKNDKDSIKSKASNLVNLVRWSFVKNACHIKDPWFYFMDAKTNTPESSDSPRSPDTTFSFRRFSEVVKLNEVLIYSRHVDIEVGGKFAPLHFTVNRPTYITGLAFHIEGNLEHLNYSSLNFDIYVNKSNATNCMNVETRGRQDGVMEWYPRYILAEFVMPVLLKDGINTIVIQPPSKDNNQKPLKFSVPVFEKDCVTMDVRSTTDPDTVFTLCNEVTGIEELFCLPN